MPEQLGWKVLEMKTKDSHGSWQSHVDFPGGLIPPRTCLPPLGELHIHQSLGPRNHFFLGVLIFSGCCYFYVSRPKPQGHLYFAWVPVHVLDKSLVAHT